jgi:DNA invertase Pin-like site-specific DNA recombinase
MRFAIYVRVSTKDQDTEMQEKDLKAEAAKREWEVEVFRDHATGTNTDRPAFKRMMAQVREGDFDGILVWKLDRMFRSMRDLIRTLHELTELEVKFVSFKENLDLTTAAGKLLCHMIGAFAEFEAAIIQERVRAGLKLARERGTKSGKAIGRNHGSIKINYYRVWELNKSGKSAAAIAQDLKIARSTVYRILRAA